MQPKNHFFALRALLLTAIALSITLLASTGLAKAPAAVPANVRQMSAQAAILVDADTGEVLYEKNADQRMYPASTTKMLTAILAIEDGHADRIVEISPNAADVETTRVRPGEEARLMDLVKQMLMISDNGAAIAVAEAVGGSVPAFAERMNEKARDIGATNSHFVNPNGMPDENHYSTARDLEKIAAYGMKLPAFKSIVGTKEATIYYLAPEGYKTYCENSNALLYDYDGATGIKTGWTRAAGGCLVASATRDGRNLIAVVLHSNNEDTRAADARALLDYGFSMEEP